MQTSTLVFFVNGKKVEEDQADPRQSLADYLRVNLGLKGTKIGCNEGGCGACTVMISDISPYNKNIRHYSVNACLFPVCSTHGKAVTTVEGIGSTRTRLHPVQERMARGHGSQCGFCTPGFVMAMYALLRNNPEPEIEEIDETLQGNLCRCTGYRPILESFYSFGKCCKNKGSGGCCMENNTAKNSTNQLTDFSAFTLYDPTQEPIFPPELKVGEFSKHSLKVEHKACTWYRPDNLHSLCELKEQFPEARIVSGNSEIGIELKFKRMEYKVLIDPRNVPELYHTAEDEEKGFFVGAGFSINELNDMLKDKFKNLTADKIKVFKAAIEMIHWFAGKHIRNTASIAGNIATASPISDLNPIWLAAGSVLVVYSIATGRREIRIDENFFIAYRKTAIRPDEIIIGFYIPYTTEDEYFYAYKQAQRREDDIAIVNAGMYVKFQAKSSVIQDIRLAFGGMAPKTVMALQTMKSLIGRKWDEAMFEDGVSLLLKDLPLPPGVPGGMERFRQTLCLSFFFKFYTTVINEKGSLNTTNGNSSPNSMVMLEGHRKPESTQIFQEVASGQPTIDPIHRPLPHLSGEKHTTGEAAYCDDIDVAKVVHLQFVLSQRAHARIKTIDTSEAERVEGVIDFIDNNAVPTFGNSLFGCGKDTPVFATDQVIHYGQPILGVIATDEENAKRAAGKVKIQYEELEPIVTVEDAIKKEAYFPPGAWTLSNHRDPETRRVLPINWDSYENIHENKVKVGGQEHFYLETHSAIAIPGEDDSMEIISSTQSVTDVQAEVAHVLGIPMHKVVGKVKRIGGGFGGKETAATNLAVRVAVAANKLKRPVRCTLERFDDMVSSGTRHPFLGNGKMAYNTEGKILAYEVDLYSNAGCTMDLSIGVIHKAVFAVDNGYYFPQITVRGTPCRTNIQSCTAFRGFGAPQSEMVTEELIDQIANKMGMRPEKVREANLYKEGDKTHFGQVLTQCNQRRCWDECFEMSEFNARLQEVQNYNLMNKWKKRGIAMVPTKFSIAFGKYNMNQAGALVHIYTDGSVLISHAGMEMGQGLHTKICAIAASTLRVPIERVHIDNTSTDKVPNTSPTAASVGSDLNGFAVQKACQTLQQRLAPYAFDNPKGSWDDWVQAAYNNRVSLSATGYHSTELEVYDWNQGEGRLFDYFVYGAACSEVEVDCLTGDHRVLRVDIVMDLGDSLNPAIDIGQIEGAFVQGYGLFTMEDLKVSPKGVWFTRGPGNYKIPSADDIPRQFHVKLLQGSSNKTNIFSSKAVGEPPLFLGSSVFFAIKDAIKSSRKDAGLSNSFRMDSPATPERVRMLCGDKISAKVPELPPENTYQPWTVQL